ncbi:HEXXH motif-containing putative peptide modification protein [Streptomyces sp. NBC_01335]|uniref:aKG-HExxH-type peptide beta-hydroxylase n=1 Tax=Streptomyces sp. NBC_01335 TaxID=2903828 RepID=UPI002E0D1E2A|nr:HEXXH motif-containing putative peptide modification protein [Streptomyces sp. NBC_01335]
MRVQPDAGEAAGDRAALLGRMRAVLDRAGVEAPPDARLRHPAAVEVVHRVQGELRAGPLHADRLRAAAAGFDRLPASGCAPAVPRGHLHRSVARALRSIPPRTRPDGQPVTAEVAEWRTPERDVLVEALEVLDTVWPQSADETRETVAEVALLDGDAIDGYTDFTIHGAVLLNRSRLAVGRDGLPGVVRCAEALVHEGTHTRCNAAASRRPFLVPAGGPEGAPRGAGGTEILVATPLRADPRPLTGLFQQVVVLARSVEFYRRLVAGGSAGSGSWDGASAAGARRALLRKGGLQAVATLSVHAGALTEEGVRVLDECAVILRSAA